jgi:hypothetical protein
MAIIENTNDIILIIGAAAAALGGIIAGFRASRCRSINICNGCLKIEREIKETPAPPPTPTSGTFGRGVGDFVPTPEAATLTPSNSMENMNCVNV